jgi:hypothetical protein
MGVDAKMGQSVTGKGKDVKEFYFEKKFWCYVIKEWNVASRIKTITF